MTDDKLRAALERIRELAARHLNDDFALPLSMNVVYDLAEAALTASTPDAIDKEAARLVALAASATDEGPRCARADDRPCVFDSSDWCVVHRVERIGSIGAARPAVPALDERKAIFEAGRATGTVEGWADYTEQAHEDEYDALARQLHESIAEGQSVALTAKALRILAPPEVARPAASATDEGPTRFDVVPPAAPFRTLDTPTAEQTATATEAYSRAKCPHNGARNCPACGMKNGYPPDYVARPAVPALDVDAVLPEADAGDLAGGTFQWGYRAGWNSARAAVIAALSPKEPTDG